MQLIFIFGTTDASGNHMTAPLADLSKFSTNADLHSMDAATRMEYYTILTSDIYQSHKPKQISHVFKQALLCPRGGFEL